ncbi:MAG: hypothetical protein JXR05_05850 [Flavobacteriaceae bacterium]
MKKQILNIGKALNKAEQKTINGGGRPCQDMCDWSGWEIADWCRTAACGLGQCLPNGYCILI